jgi:hypothetical protein
MSQALELGLRLVEVVRNICLILDGLRDEVLGEVLDCR